MYKRFQFYVSMLIWGAFMATGCKKLVEVGLPPDRIATDKAFSDSSTANAAIIGIYSEMISNLNFQQFISSGTAIYGDELNYTLSNADLTSFRDCSVLPSNATLNSLWTNAFKHIYQANLALEKLEVTNVLSDGLRNRLMGEALFVRAFCNYYLAGLFGGIPLVTTTDYQISRSQPRAAVDEVYQAVLTDLRTAQQLMVASEVSYPNTRPGAAAVTALLSRVLVVTRKWQEAEMELSKVIDPGTYLPLPGPNSVFLNNSRETIFQLYPVNPTFATPDGNVYFVTTTGILPVYPLHDSLVGQFEAKDLRLAAWTGNNTVAGKKYYYPAKYKIKSLSTGSSPGEYCIVFRVSELLLLRAEARAQQDRLEDAAKDLELVRVRAGLTAMATPLEKEKLLTEIRQQRRLELFTEWGHRWMDLRRHHLADLVMKLIKPKDWKASDTLWPVPGEQRISNPNLGQNPGYN